MKTEPLDGVERSLGWLIVLGIVMVLLGIAAIVEPFVATVAVVRILSWTFLFAGIVRTAHALQSRHQRGFGLTLLAGLLYIGVGILLLSNVFGAKLTLTLAVGISIVAQGMLEIIAAFQMRPARNWGVMLTSGIISMSVGILILYRWPFNATWLLGFFMGISFICTGIWMITLPRSIRDHLSRS